jgi:ADP-heptose:LPS heptosyltransferase
MREALSSVRRILVVKLTSIGDVAQTIPSVAALAERFPGAEIDWLCGGAAAPIVRELPIVTRVIDEVDETRYDLALDFQGRFASAWATRRARAALRVGRGPWPWLDRRVPKFDHERTPHAIRNTARLLEAIGMSVDDASAAGERLFARLRPSMLRRGRERARELGLEAFEAWFPRTRWRSKDLPLERLSAGAPHGNVVLLGDAALARFSSPGVLNLAGRLGLVESVALALAAERVLAADTGPAHLASLLGARVVGLFGPTRARRSGFRGPFAVNVESSCRGCYFRYCPRARACMREAALRAEEIPACA